MTNQTRSGRVADIIDRARSLHSDLDLDPVLDLARGRRVVAIGEASHGTHEYYDWRARLSRRLIEEQEFTWIGVEGDWPDCWRIDRWVRGQGDQSLDARGLLADFDRWPTWMWANAEVAEFLDWLRVRNAARPAESHVGFYGLDVYSLWDSLDRIMSWLGDNAPDSLPAAMRAWQCFAPFHEDPHRYAWSTRLVPENCETDVVNLLLETRLQAASDGDDAFDAVQNAAIAVEAENYYRAMVRTDRGSWNIRDTHMVDTVDRISAHLGTASKGILWAHNTHVGDGRGTPMAGAGLVTVGQLLRQRRGSGDVLLVGMAGHRGAVIAGSRWGAPEQRMPVPPAREGSHEGLLHDALGAPAVLDLITDPSPPWLSDWRGHRAIGVVYDPQNESGNYVPTLMGRRYDALLWFEETSPLVPLKPEPVPAEAEYETEPTGY